MKLQTFFAFAALFTLLSLSAACSKLGLTTTKNPVEQLMTLCKEDKYKEAAKHMQNPGMDPNKKDMTADYESGDANEKRQVENSCRRFKTLSEKKPTISAKECSKVSTSMTLSLRTEISKSNNYGRSENRVMSTSWLILISLVRHAKQIAMEVSLSFCPTQVDSIFRRSSCGDIDDDS